MKDITKKGVITVTVRTLFKLSQWIRLLTILNVPCHTWETDKEFCISFNLKKYQKALAKWVID